MPVKLPSKPAGDGVQQRRAVVVGIDDYVAERAAPLPDVLRDPLTRDGAVTGAPPAHPPATR